MAQAKTELPAELVAMNTVVRALEAISDEELGRVMDYLISRYYHPNNHNRIEAIEKNKDRPELYAS